MTTQLIREIDGLFVVEDEQMQPFGDDGELVPVCVYWPCGYETLEQAREAIRRTQVEHLTPEGIRVDMNTGRRKS